MTISTETPSSHPSNIVFHALNPRTPASSCMVELSSPSRGLCAPGERHIFRRSARWLLRKDRAPSGFINVIEELHWSTKSDVSGENPNTESFQISSGVLQEGNNCPQSI